MGTQYEVADGHVFKPKRVVLHTVSSIVAVLFFLPMWLLFFFIALESSATMDKMFWAGLIMVVALSWGIPVLLVDCVLRVPRSVKLVADRIVLETWRGSVSFPLTSCWIKGLPFWSTYSVHRWYGFSLVCGKQVYHFQQHYFPDFPEIFRALTERSVRTQTGFKLQRGVDLRELSMQIKADMKRLEELKKQIPMQDDDAAG